MRGIVAVCLCALLALAAAPNPGARAHERKTQTEHPQPAPATGRAVQNVQPSQPTEYYRPCQKNGKDRYSDLCAQWTAAQGAEDAAYWAFWSVWVGFVGLIGLGFTLYLTTRSTRAAIQTLDAQIAAERPLMQLDYAKVAKTPESTDKNLSLSLVWRLHNHGRTGAWIEAASIVVEDRHDEEKIGQVERSFNAFIPVGKYLGYASIGPEWTFHEDETANVVADKVVYIWGYSIYRDAGGRRWKTGFAHCIRLDDEMTGDVLRPQALDEHWYDTRLHPRRVHWWNRLLDKLKKKEA